MGGAGAAVAFTVGCDRCLGRFWKVHVGQQKTDQDMDMHSAGWAGTFLKALEDQALERGLTKSDDRRTIPRMIHAKTSIVKETPGVVGTAKPGRVLELESDGFTDGIMVSIAEGRGWSIEKLGERYFRHGTALNIHRDNHTVIRGVDLLSVGHSAVEKGEIRESSLRITEILKPDPGCT
jgi:hypothetical protein